MSDIAWTNDTRKLSDLVPWEHNPKRMTKKQAEGLRLSIERFGFAVPFLISPTGDIYDGHQRQALMGAIREYGPNATVDVRVSSRPLTDDERRELVVRLKQNQAGWDFDMLPNLYDKEELIEWGFELEELGMFPDDDAPEDPGAQIDRAAELQEQWQTATGQLWAIGEHRLAVGDCTDAAVVARVMGGEKAQACIADPPYGMNWSADASRFTGGKFGNQPRGRERDDVINDDKPFDPSPFLSFPVVALWGMNHYCDKLPPGGALVWIKKPDERFGTFLSDCEIAWTNVGHGIYALRHDWGGITRESERGEFLHPTQKPVALMEWVMEKTGAGNLIFDPFLGSGTTMVAAHRLGRRCFGIEIDPGYAAVCLQRMSDMGLTPELVP